MPQFQLKDGRIIDVDPTTLTPEQKAKLRDLVAPGPPSLLQPPEPRGLETGPQPNQPEGSPMTWGQRGQIAGDVALGFMGGGGPANPLSGALNALLAGGQSWSDIENQQSTMGPSRAADVTGALTDLATKRVPLLNQASKALPWMTDVARGLMSTGATAGEMAREGTEITPETATSLVAGGVAPPAVAGGFAELTRRAAPKAEPMVRERLEREIPQITRTQGEPGAVPGTPMDPNIRRTFQQASADLHTGIPAIEAGESLRTGPAQLAATEAQQASARIQPVAQAVQATKKERAAFDRAKSAWEVEKKKASEEVLTLRHKLVDRPGDEDLKHKLLNAQFKVAQLREPPTDIRSVSETLKTAKDTERKARQELAKARMRWSRIKSNTQAVHEVYDNVEKVSGLRLENLDPASKEILRRMAADSPEEFADNVFARVFRKADEPQDASLARIEALEKAFGKKSGTIRALQISAAKRFMETAVDQATGSPQQFKQFVDQLGPGTINKLFGHDQAYKQFLDLTEAVTASESMKRRRFWTTIKASITPTGLLFFFPSIGAASGTGNMERAAAGFAAAGAANVILEWDRITEMLLKKKVPLITKYIRELATDPDAGRFGNVLARQVHRYISGEETARQQPKAGETPRGPVTISPSYFER